MSDGTSWTTEDELDFIRGLGTHAPTSIVVDRFPMQERPTYAKTMTAADLRSRYLEACMKRQNWGRIDRHACVHEALTCGHTDDATPTTA